jgi:putative oxidoreductase
VVGGTVLVSVFGIIAGALLIVGLLTPFASVAVALLFAFQLTSSDCTMPNLLGGAVGFALVLLGPGAYSVDLKIFGPREIVIPRAPRMREL